MTFGIDTTPLSSVVYADKESATHLPHRLCRVAAGRSRSQPVRLTRKCLLQLVIPGRSRPCRLRPSRPVTPEVAGSSPVAPVKIPANQDIVLPVQTPTLARLHKRAFARPRNPQKRPKRV